MSRWSELKKEKWNKSATGNPTCAFCSNPAVDLHHALISRMKGRVELDVKYNALPLCKHCHKYHGGYWQKQKSWSILCEKYGSDVMQEWYEGLELKVKEKFW